MAHRRRSSAIRKKNGQFRKNPHGRKRRTARRTRRNPIDAATRARLHGSSGRKAQHRRAEEVALAGIAGRLEARATRERKQRRAGRPRRKGRKATTTSRRRSYVRRLRGLAARTRKAGRKLRPRSAGRATRMTQARRYGTLAYVAGRRGVKTAQKSPLMRAMTVKSNPGIEGLKNALMLIAPQAGVGALALAGLSLAGAKLSKMITHDGEIMKPSWQKSPGLVVYIPAIATAGLAVGAYVLADKIAPKFKGAVVIGGLLAAAIQVVAAAQVGASADSLLTRAALALGLHPAAPPTTPAAAPAVAAATPVVTPTASATLKGYLGEYTTVGDSALRPRNSADSNMQWAQDSLRGVDDASRFSPGEGGVLSGNSGGGIFGR